MSAPRRVVTEGSGRGRENWSANLRPPVPRPSASETGRGANAYTLNSQFSCQRCMFWLYFTILPNQIVSSPL